MARTSRLLATAAILLACTVAGHAASGVDYPRKIEPVFSLAPPYFRDIPFWQPGGTAHVFEDFVRLTADAQHNRGWIWNSVPAEIGSEWEVDFKFRSFGNGEKFFGDGLAFWYTERSGVPGPVLGNQDKWKGLGVFFDTYDNRDKRHAHKHPFVHAIVNDGTKSYTLAVEEPQHANGCHAEFRDRYVNTRVSIARIRYQKGTLSVRISTAKDTWKDCFTLKNVFLPPGYFFGATSSTGDLSDNHDLLGIEVYKLNVPATQATESPAKPTTHESVQQPAGPERALAGVAEGAPGAGPHTHEEGKAAAEEEADDDSGGSDDDDKVSAEELEGISEILKSTTVVRLLQEQSARHNAKLQEMHNHLETQMQSLNSHIVTILESLQQAESEVERRLRSLEDRVHQKVDSIEQHTVRQGRSWLWPFVALAGCLVAGVVIGARKYRALLKTHLP